jgi:hypothetical protein
MPFTRALLLQPSCLPPRGKSLGFFAVSCATPLDLFALVIFQTESHGYARPAWTVIFYMLPA